MLEFEDVDICVTCVTSKPPRLPLREELVSLGVEVILNARGVGAQAVKHEKKKEISAFRKEFYANEHRILCFPLRKSYKQKLEEERERKKLERELRKKMQGLSYAKYNKRLNRSDSSDVSSVSSWGTNSTGRSTVNSDKLLRENRVGQNASSMTIERRDPENEMSHHYSMDAAVVSAFARTSSAWELEGASESERMPTLHEGASVECYEGQEEGSAISNTPNPKIAMASGLAAVSALEAYSFLSSNASRDNRGKKRGSSDKFNEVPDSELTDDSSSNDESLFTASDVESGQERKHEDEERMSTLHDNATFDYYEGGSATVDTPKPQIAKASGVAAVSTLEARWFLSSSASRDNNGDNRATSDTFDEGRSQEKEVHSLSTGHTNNDHDFRDGGPHHATAFSCTTEYPRYLEDSDPQDIADQDDNSLKDRNVPPISYLHYVSTTGQVSRLAHDLMAKDLSGKHSLGASPDEKSEEMSSFFSALSRGCAPDTSDLPSLVRCDYQAYGRFNPDGNLPLHLICDRDFPDRFYLPDLDIFSIVDDLIDDILNRRDELDIVTSCYHKACSMHNKEGDLPVHLLMRRLIEWETVWQDKVRSVCVEAWTDAAKFTHLHKVMGQCVDIVLHPIGSNQLACRSRGRRGSRLLPLHAAAIFAVHYDTMQTILETYPEAAAVPCDLGGLRNSIANHLLPLELLERPRSEALSASINVDITNKNDQDSTPAMTGDSFDGTGIRWSTSILHSPNHGAGDFIRLSDLLFAFHPGILPFRKDAARLRRIELLIRVETQRAIEHKVQGIDLFDAAARSAWIWLCTFDDSIDENDTYVDSVRRIVTALDLPAVKLLASTDTSHGTLLSTAQPECAHIIQSRLDERLSCEFEVAKNNDMPRTFVQRSDSMQGNQRSILKQGGSATEISRHYSISFSKESLCRDVFNVRETVLPTNFIILPYMLFKKTDGALTLGSMVFASAAIQFAECLTRMTAPWHVQHILEKKAKDCLGHKLSPTQVSNFTSLDWRSLTLRKTMLNLFEGSGFLYFLDKSSGAPIVPSSSESNGASPIILENPAEAIERLLPLMLMGMLQMRGEKSTVLLVQTMMEGKHAPPERWITLSQNLVRYMYSKRSQESSGTPFLKGILSLSDALADFVSRATGRNAGRRPESEDGCEWVSELSYLKTLLNQSTGGVPSSTKLTSETSHQANMVVSGSKKKVVEETDGPSLREPIPRKSEPQAAEDKDEDDSEKIGATTDDDISHDDTDRETDTDDSLKSEDVWSEPRDRSLDKPRRGQDDSEKIGTPTDDDTSHDDKDRETDTDDSLKSEDVWSESRDQSLDKPRWGQDDSEKIDTPTDDDISHDDEDRETDTDDSLKSEDVWSEPGYRSPDKPRWGQDYSEKIFPPTDDNISHDDKDLETDTDDSLKSEDVWSEPRNRSPDKPPWGQDDSEKILTPTDDDISHADKDRETDTDGSLTSEDVWLEPQDPSPDKPRWGLLRPPRPPLPNVDHKQTQRPVKNRGITRPKYERVGYHGTSKGAYPATKVVGRSAKAFSPEAKLRLSQEQQGRLNMSKIFQEQEERLNGIKKRLKTLDQNEQFVGRLRPPVPGSSGIRAPPKDRGRHHWNKGQGKTRGDVGETDSDSKSDDFKTMRKMLDETKNYNTLLSARLSGLEDKILEREIQILQLKLGVNSFEIDAAVATCPEFESSNESTQDGFDIDVTHKSNSSEEEATNKCESSDESNKKMFEISSTSDDHTDMTGVTCKFESNDEFEDDVILVQSIVRCQAASNIVERKRHQQEDHSATLIHSVWRGYSAWSSYQRALLDIITVQRFVRGRAARIDAEREQHQSAKTIQSAWRSFYALSRYQSDLRRISVVQCLLRCRAAKNIVEQKRLQLNDQSATTIQTAWRGYCARSSYMSDIHGVVIVQCLVRRRAGRKITEQIRRQLRDQSATEIQTAWRGYSGRSSYLSDVSNIILVQSHVRRRDAGNIVEQKVRQLQDQSTMVIQSAWRGYCAWSSYQRVLLDIIIVQGFVRCRVVEQKRRHLIDPNIMANESLDSENTDFMNVDDDCGLMDPCQDTESSDKSQDSYRSSSTLNSIMNEAVGFLSRASEGRHLTEADNGHIVDVHGVSENMTHNSDSSDESKDPFRNNATSKSIMDEAVGFLPGASEEERLIEADDRQNINIGGVNEDESHKSDISSKSNSTLNSIMNEAEGFLSRALEGGHLIEVDTRHMMYVNGVNEDTSHKTESRDNSKDSSKSTSTLNSIMNEAVGFLSPTLGDGRLIEVNDRPIMKAQGVNQDMKKEDATQTFESSDESNKKKSENNLDSTTGRGTFKVDIAGLIRRFESHGKCKDSFEGDMKDAILMQGLVHRHAPRNITEQKRRQLEDPSATVIQSVWRGYRAWSSCQRVLLEISIVQRFVRGRAARIVAEQEQHQSATTIQSAWRSFYALSRYQSDLRRISVVQCLVRCRAAKNIVEQKRHQLNNQSATTIQTAWRGYCARSSSMSDTLGVVIVQCLVRRRVARKKAEQMWRQLRDQSATEIQTAWRVYSGRSSYLSDVSNIILVQSHVRRRAAGNIVEQKVRQLQDQSAMVIQSAWRGYCAWSSYQRVLLDLIIVQGFARRRIVEQKRRDHVHPSVTASESPNSENTDFMNVDDDCGLTDSYRYAESSDKSQKSYRSNSTLNSIMNEVVGFLSRASEGGHLIEADDTHVTNVRGANENQCHKSDSSDESKNSSKSNSTFKSVTDEAVGYLPWTSDDGRMIEADDTHIMNVRGANENQSHKSDSSDKSKDSSKSNSTFNSIMNEAVGFLSRASEGGRLIEADNGHIMYVQGMNENKSHKSDSTDASKDSPSSNSNPNSMIDEAVGYLPWTLEEGRLIEADNTHIRNVRGANEDASHKSDSTDKSKDSSKSNSTFNSILNEAVGFLSRASEGGRLIEADNGHVMYVRGMNENKSQKSDSTDTSKDLLSSNSNADSIVDEAVGYLPWTLEEGRLIDADDTHIRNVRGVNEDESHKSNSSDKSKNSFKSSSTFNSIMNEAVGFLSRASEGGRLIEADNGHVMYVQGVEEGLQEDKSHKSESSDKSKDSFKSNATLNSIMNEAVGFLSRTSDEARLVAADDGHLLYVRGGVTKSLDNSRKK